MKEEKRKRRIDKKQNYLLKKSIKTILEKKRGIHSLKAQSELMGIVIVVLLVSFGMLFAFKISSEKKEPIKRSFDEKQLVSNTLGTFLRSTSTCNHERISSLITDCGGSCIITCPGFPTGTGTGVKGNDCSSCLYLEKNANFIFENTLAKWGKNYTFEMYKTTKSKIVYVQNGKCAEYQESQTQPFPVYGDIIYIRLDLCSAT